MLRNVNIYYAKECMQFVLSAVAALAISLFHTGVSRMQPECGGTNKANNRNSRKWNLKASGVQSMPCYTKEAKAKR